MILANVRARFAPSDADCVVSALANGDVSRERELRALRDQKGLDVLLDDPRLPARLEQDDRLVGTSVALLLYVAVRHRLKAVGLDDPELADYLGALLLEFGGYQRAYRIAQHDDATYHSLADIVAAIDGSEGPRGFLLRVHLGNFSLWLAGVFPDYIAARRNRSGAPDLTYFESLGARGFRMAADHRLARAYDLDGIYARAAEAFCELRVALNRLSDRLLFPHWHSPTRLLRQVADDSLLC